MTDQPDMKHPPGGQAGRALNASVNVFDDDERRPFTAFASIRQVRVRRGGDDQRRS